MKNLILFVVIFVTTHNLCAQENFEWDVIDSIPKLKNQIYTDTKLFIADNWRESKAVIQNDDKEGGNILLKGLTCPTIKVMTSDYTYCYDYTVIFMMKDNKFRIKIYDVYYNENFSTGKLGMRIPFDGQPEMSAIRLGLTLKQWANLMSWLKQDLQKIVDSYVYYMNSSTPMDDW